MPQHNDNLIWIDLEMTGLSPDSDRIIEIATIVTDRDLNLLAEGPVIAVHQSDEDLARMDAWNVRTHGASGLTERVRASTIDDAAAERITIAFLDQWVAQGASPMCGNSICQDRRFLARWMPELWMTYATRSASCSTTAPRSCVPRREVDAAAAGAAVVAIVASAVRRAFRPRLLHAR